MKKLKETIKNIMKEESEYQTFFKKALEKSGKSIDQMSDEEKKAFFNKIDAAWDAKGEKNEELVGNQHKLDVDGDGEIEASDLAALRAGKKKNESVKEGLSADIAKHMGFIHKGFVKVEDDGTMIYDSPANAKKASDYLNSKKIATSSNGKYLYIESVNENFSPSDIEKIKGAVTDAASFMQIGRGLQKLGFKYSFGTSPYPVYMIKKGSKTYVLINKKYAEDPEFVIGDTAGGLLEGKVNEGKLGAIWQKNNKKGYVLKVGNVKLESGGPSGTHTIYKGKNEYVWGKFHLDYESGGVDWWVEPGKGNDFWVDSIDDIVKRVEADSRFNEGKVNESHFKVGDKLKHKKASIGTFVVLDTKNGLKVKNLNTGKVTNDLINPENFELVNESQFKSGDKVIISHPTLIKPFKSVVGTVLTPNGNEVLVLKSNHGIWDAKFAKLDEGNAFGAAVTKAKKEGKKEFEFNGKTYKVKKGSYEKNESAKKLAEKSEAVTKK